MMMVMMVIEAGALVAFATPQETAVVEHVLGQRIQCPEVAFARIAGLARHLDEAIVQAEIVPYGVLPGGELVLVVWKPVGLKMCSELKFCRRKIITSCYLQCATFQLIYR